MKFTEITQPAMTPEIEESVRIAQEYTVRESDWIEIDGRLVKRLGVECDCEEGPEHETDCRLHPEYDPTPWCSGCGARRREDCHCGPMADNE